MADELRARLSVDTSSFKAGMADAASSTRTLKDASAELKVSLDNLSQAEAEFGAAAAGGNQQAAAALAVYREEARRAESAMSQLGASEVRETTALRSSISARMAASAEMRVLEMNTQGSTRAAAALIASIPGLSTFAQAIFPLFGVAALVGVAVQVGDGLAKAFDLGGERARALRKDIQDVNNELNHSITSIDVQIDKLQQEQAKLEKKPFNGMKLVLDEAAEAAQNLADKLDSVIQREAKVISAEAASIPQKILLGGTGTKYEQTMLEEHTKWLNQAVNEQQQLNESASFGNSLQTRLNELKGLQADADARSASAASAGAYAARVNYDNEIKAVQDLMAYQQREQQLVQKSIDLNKQQAATQHARDTHTTGGDPDEKRLRGIETQFAELNTKLPEEAIAFWRQYVGAFKEGSSEYLHVIEEINRYTDQFEKGLSRQSEIVKKYESEKLKLANLSPEGADKALEESHKWLLAIDDDLTKSGERWNEYAVAQRKAEEIEAENSAALAKQRIAIEEAEGVLRPMAAAEQKAAIDAEEYRRKLQALNEELARLKKEAQGLSPGQEGFSKNQTQQAQVQNQILGVQGQAGLSGAQDQESIAKQMAQPYITAANDIENAFTKAFTQVALRQKSWEQAMAGVLVNLELQAAQAAEKWLTQWIDAEILSLAKHILTNQQKAASDAEATVQTTAATTAAAAADHAIVTTANVAEILSYAAVAAAAAAASAAIGGPVAMAAAAGAAYAEVSAFAPLASLAVGTNYIPKTGLYELHEAERVIPAADNRQLMGALQGGGGGGSRSSTTNVRSTINNHYNNPGKPPSAREQAAALHNLVRRGHA